MSAKSNLYWPVFLIVAALSVAVVWRFAPSAPLSPSVRALCVKWAHKARQCVGLENPPQATALAAPRPMEMKPLGEEAPATTAKPAGAQKRENGATAQKRPSPKTAETPIKVAAKKSIPPPAKQEPSAKQKPPARVTAVVQADAAPQQPASSDPDAEQIKKSDDAIAMTPAQRKQKYDELTKKAEARRLEILRENISKSPEGKKALAAVKAFNELAAKVDELKKKYGETDSRVTGKRGDLLKLKDEVRRTNDAYKKWKEKHSDQIVVPEADPLYRKIIGERQLYSN